VQGETLFFSTNMLSQEEIDHQHELLVVYRRTLAHLLTQAAQYGGEVHAPPQVVNGVFEARENIRSVKASLRTNHVPVEDHPDDEQSRQQTAVGNAQPISRGTTSTVITGDQINITGGGDYARGDIDKRRGVFVSGGHIQGPLIGANAGTIITKSILLCNHLLYLLHPHSRYPICQTRSLWDVIGNWNG
jgi:hypothetical protein